MKKPRLRFDARGFWFCESGPNEMTIGTTAAEAYENWKFIYVDHDCVWAYPGWEHFADESKVQ